ncbi:hypothetical protein PNOK_0051200 [Pyrrhoderma noxium]|uniref:Uncharacterized protein n=1 Tax=Pyrrhoderma noxium TaxID=2282107 RepID=A0A286UV58_9AGAM|nr:hypothetical protein PNOK_0051200 [Pyrrhoderma noxium]
MPHNFNFDRRGGGSIATDTLESSSYPTTPPASTETHFKSIPTIGGSEGGFIGLVVGLGVILIVSCVSIFLLLRCRKHGGRSIQGKSGEVGVETPRRRGTLFGFKSKNPRGSGWIRAPDGEADEERDVWDANMHDAAGPYDPVQSSVKMERSAYGDVTTNNQKKDDYEPPQRPRVFPDPFDVDEYANSNTKNGGQPPTSRV